jgi:MbtH protein
MSGEDEDLALYKVVVNHEEQYSIWPIGRDPPFGWQVVDKSGQKAECLEYIKTVWVDMRPLSLRRRQEKRAGAD